MKLDDYPVDPAIQWHRELIVVARPKQHGDYAPTGGCGRTERKMEALTG
ncbi:MAG TPA: hypothetical protein VE860_01425 [Chthoniobacterales bacterium]|nr:hypothetical protein [Chthoniobacterales bacterium]